MNYNNEIILTRLAQERKNWRKQKIAGFSAKPIKKRDGSYNMKKWICEIPGPKNTIWEKGYYKLYMEFPKDFPLKPPRCYFKPVLPHPNIYPSGTVCLSILNDEEDWKPSITIKNILLGIQKLLKDSPNLNSPAQLNPTKLFRKNRKKYVENAIEFAKSQKRG